MLQAEVKSLCAAKTSSLVTAERSGAARGPGIVTLCPGTTALLPTAPGKRAWHRTFANPRARDGGSPCPRERGNLAGSPRDGTGGAGVWGCPTRLPNPGMVAQRRG